MTAQTPQNGAAATVDEDLCYLSATEARRMFRSGALSPVELMTAVIARAEQTNPLVNAFSETSFDEAMDRARAAEAVFARDPSSARPLEGLPLAFKDEVWLEGTRQSEGSLAFKDEVATSTAPLAERILEAGAINHARTTTPEFCIVPYTHSRLWGLTPSPWDLGAASGGSSGGSGAALAAGSTTLATGSDIGGSIRIPAAWCGVSGLKPSFGRIPDVTPWNLDRFCANGPMARTIEDVALLFDVMQGPHPADIATLRPKLDVPESFESIEGWRVAVCIRLGEYEVDERIVANTYAAADALRDAGAIVEEVELPWTWDLLIGAAAPHWGSIMGAEPRSHVEGKWDLLNDYSVEFFEKTAKGLYVDSVPSGIARENRMYESLSAVLERNRVLLCPTVAALTLEAGNSYIGTGPVINGVQTTETNQALMTFPFNVLGRCPVVAMPSGLSPEGFPTSVQIVGRTYADIDALTVAAALESRISLYGPGARPGFSGRL